MFSHFPDKIKEMHFLKPVKIIYHLRCIWDVLIEIKKFLQLLTDTLQIMIST